MGLFRKINIGFIVIFLYLIIKGIEVLTIEKDVFCSDRTVCIFTIGGTILNTIFLITIIYNLLSNYFFEKVNHYIDDEINTSYLCSGIFVCVDFVISSIYFFFSNDFINNYRSKFLKNQLISSYIYPKIGFGILVSLFILLVAITVILYILDDICCQKLFRNHIILKKRKRRNNVKHKSTTSIRRNHNSVPDEGGNLEIINENDMLY
jgi:hypothetical protein